MDSNSSRVTVSYAALHLRALNYRQTSPCARIMIPACTGATTPLFVTFPALMTCGSTSRFYYWSPPESTTWLRRKFNHTTDARTRYRRLFVTILCRCACTVCLIQSPIGGASLILCVCSEGRRIALSSSLCITIATDDTQEVSWTLGLSSAADEGHLRPPSVRSLHVGVDASI